MVVEFVVGLLASILSFIAIVAVIFGGFFIFGLLWFFGMMAMLLFSFAVIENIDGITKLGRKIINLLGGRNKWDK